MGAGDSERRQMASSLRSYTNANADSNSHSFKPYSTAAANTNPTPLINRAQLS